MSHNLNPFDFVPFSDKEIQLKTVKEWLEYGDLLTGYIELKIKALYPMHIVGEQRSVGLKEDDWRIEYSSFYRRNCTPCIPSSSIRGALRSFIEAICNCWASQLIPFYKKEKKKHYTGFRVLESSAEIDDLIEKKLIDDSIDASIDGKFVPKYDKDGRIDLASFLFGAVVEEMFTEPNKEKESLSVKSRIFIEDAFLDPSDLDNKTYKLPDIAHSAFMGGAKPSASSWWYQKPFEIRLKGKFKVPQFVGSGFWGRKFYYHQNPHKCVDYYVKSKEWNSDQKRQLYLYQLECFIPDRVTKPFRIYFEDVPARILNILLLSLFLGENIRHKIGYGKPYGFGSVEFQKMKIEFCRAHENEKQKLLKFKNGINWKNEILDECKKEDNLIDLDSLKSIYKILYFDRSNEMIFSYPPFYKGYFLPQDTKKFKDDLFDIIKGLLSETTLNQLKDTPHRISTKGEVGKNLASQIYLKGMRRALHFEVYKENASNFSEIDKRSFI